MGVYAVTGSASGMGHAVAEKLRAAGHRVIGVDIKDADVVADLSTPDGRAAASEAVSAGCDGRLDGAVLAAGLGPTPGAANVPRILAVNFFGVVELAEAWRPALAAAGKAKVVAVASNSATTMPGVPKRAVRALLSCDLVKAERAVRLFRSAAPRWPTARRRSHCRGGAAHRGDPGMGWRRYPTECNRSGGDHDTPAGAAVGDAA